MPILKPRYEAFCRSYAEHPNAGYAAEDAGYSGINVDRQGRRLLQRPEIVARIAELRAEQATLDGLSLHAQILKLESAYHIAYQEGDALALARIVKIGAELPALYAKASLAMTMAPGGAAPGAEPTRAALARIARQLGVAPPREPDEARKD